MKLTDFMADFLKLNQPRFSAPFRLICAFVTHVFFLRENIVSQVRKLQVFYIIWVFVIIGTHGGGSRLGTASAPVVTPNNHRVVTTRQKATISLLAFLKHNKLK